jgi:hypothetical protein
MKLIFTFTVLIFSFIFARAQQLNLWENSSAAGAYAIGANPAMMADSRMKWMANLGAISGNLSANTSYVDFVPFSKTAITLQSEANRIQNMKVCGPAFMYQMANGAAVGLGFIHRSYQYQPDFFATLLSEKASVISAPFLDRNSLAVAVKEMILSYAHPISYGSHMLKAGIDLKLGKLQNFLNSSPTNIISTGNQLSFNNNGLTSGGPSSFTKVYLGAGADASLGLGLVYEFRPNHANYEYQMDGKKRVDPSLDKHLFRIGFSISDIGNLNQELFAYQNNIVQSLPTIKIDSDLATYLDARTNPISKGKRALHLPTQSTVFAEAPIGKKGWSLGAVYRSEVKDYYLPLGQESIMALYPKKASQDNELAFPVVFNPVLKQLGVGVHVRYGSFMLGTESLNGFFFKNSMNPGFYAGLNISKLAQKIRDTDKDNVSDIKDI